MDAHPYHDLAEFRYRLRCYLHQAELEAHRHGIEAQQYQLLLALAGLSPGDVPSVGVLAERMQLRHHSAVELVKRCERRRLLRRSRNQQDGRVITVSLTARGSQVLARLTRWHRRELGLHREEIVRSLGRAVPNARGKRSAP